ncbi:hypothetical protein CWO91_06050 [Bradyrhizobium genosp. SA-3]|nr:hypothetical protein CWO91_06050 [Bradyrhizobium genosp. SA-3]
MTMLKQRASTSAVIARLDRAIQYPEAVVIEPRGRGVLDSPLSRGMTVSRNDTDVQHVVVLAKARTHYPRK